MTRIAIADLFRPVEIDLWGREYKSVPVTQQVKADLLRVQAEGEALGKEIDAIDAPLTDEQEAMFGRRMIEVKARLLSCRFRPAGQQRKPVEDVLMERWDAGEVGEDEIDMLLEAVGEATQRPT